MRVSVGLETRGYPGPRGTSGNARGRHDQDRKLLEVVASNQPLDECSALHRLQEPVDEHETGPRDARDAEQRKRLFPILSREDTAARVPDGVGDGVEDFAIILDHQDCLTSQASPLPAATGLSIDGRSEEQASACQVSAAALPGLARRARRSAWPARSSGHPPARAEDSASMRWNSRDGTTRLLGGPGRLDLARQRDRDPGASCGALQVPGRRVPEDGVLMRYLGTRDTVRCI